MQQLTSRPKLAWENLNRVINTWKTLDHPLNTPPPPHASKILEWHVKSIIEKHLPYRECPNLTMTVGFVASCSTVSTLIKVIDEWTCALDQGYEVCVVYFDVRKAFNTVQHLPLLKSMDKLGLDRPESFSCRRIRSYRSQFVAVDGCKLQFICTASCTGSPSRISARTTVVHMLHKMMYP